ncbi:MAG: SdpI family protein [Anaerolineaceae bacterium]|nr:SdpI family protein [Anaerolineaceae bacterium]
MSNKTTTWISFIIIAILVAVGLVLLPQLPDQVPSHWNDQGQVDGYSSKLTGVLLMPGILLATLLLLLVVPSIDPRRANIAKFRPQYNVFILCFVLFLAYLYILTLLAGLGIKFDMNRMLVPALGLLFIFVGSMVRHAKRNYMIGIRTPWTLHSNVVWDQTHKVGGIAFMIAGAFTMVTVFVPQFAVPVMMVSVLLVTVGTIVYSYIVYRQVENNSATNNSND